ncbi:3-oxoacid CoA-transferase subunit A [Bradyrhizobium sp. LHD-71]|uniref:CoA transferase subunit A n=1 Tax=Bradyrhizobium sp. LHD-71 TaxID=3072141 RepID=UPI00280DE8D9|nr:3-oxoacid CoA-transferase subunit A [Bradyrhizobium sp. LHD-71]MDQ8730861.1 3-oxoacid CoA-transferase subunit A [Bradyrhizobium sp. LHD-71]
MAVDKRVKDATAALEGVADGMRVMVSGFGDAGMPNALIDALIERGPKDLTLIVTGAGMNGSRLAMLFEAKMIAKVICSAARGRDGLTEMERQWKAGKVELELVPQGTFAERIRAAGAGIPAFFTPVSYGTPIGAGKDVREFEGRKYVMEHWLKGDVALLRAERGDRFGNLQYHGAQANFGPAMATAATLTVVEVKDLLAEGAIPPQQVGTPGIYVNHILALPDLRR